MSSESIPKSVDMSLKIPTFPATVARIDAVLTDSEFELSDLAEIVAQDPPIAASVLSSANSAFYGMVEPVTSVRGATAALGASCIRNLAFKAALITEYEHLEKHRAFDLQSQWKHSILTAQLAQALAARCDGAPREAADLAYTAGLLHDLGKMILLDTMEEGFLQAQQAAIDNNEPQYISEDTLLGINHAAAGGIAGYAWKLPETITAAIEDHHDASRIVDSPVVAAVTLADDMAKKVQRGEELVTEELQSHPACGFLALSPADIELVMALGVSGWADISI